MVFTKRLRDRIRRGEITCSVRIWMRPHVKIGGRYPMDEGEIEVDSIEPIGRAKFPSLHHRKEGWTRDQENVAKHPLIARTEWFSGGARKENHPGCVFRWLREIS